MIQWEKNFSHFDLNSWVTGGTKIRPGEVDNWRIFESNWLNIVCQIDSTLRVKLTQHWESNWLNFKSQIDSNILQLPTLPGRILVPLVTQLFRSKWLNFFSRCIVLACTSIVHLINKLYYSRLVFFLINCLPQKVNWKILAFCTNP